MRKYGVENVNEHFKSFNNICDASQVISFPVSYGIAFPLKLY